MNTAWNTVSVAQQQQFLQQTGFTSLPAMESLDDAHWTLLAGILGEQATQELRQAAEDSVAEPVLPAPKAVGDWSDIMMLVAEIRAKLGEVQSKTASEDIEIQKDRIADANRHEMEQLQESLKKLKKSVKSGLFGKIFGWIGAVAGVIGAAVATALTGGAAAPALAVAALGLTMMILQETGTMEKIVSLLADNPGALFAAFAPFGILGIAAAGTLFGLIQSDVLDTDGAKAAIQIALSASMVVVTIASVVVSGGASVPNLVRCLGAIGQAITGVGSGAATIASSVYSHQAASFQADVEENKAWLARLQAMLSEEMDRLQEVINRLTEGVANASEILSDIADSNRSVIANLGM